MSEGKSKLRPSEVTCTWDNVHKIRIIDAISFSTEGLEGNPKDWNSIVSLETCVLLSAKEEFDHLSDRDDYPSCVLELRPEKLKIKSFIIFSEARLVEVYGNCGEYILTSHGELIEGCPDLGVFVIEVKLPRPSKECSIKFARMKDKGEMWLFGMHIIAESCKNLSPQNRIDFQNVNNMLKESGHQLSENAEKYKTLLQLYSSYWDLNKYHNMPPNTHNLLKLFEAECLSQYSQIGTQAKNVKTSLTDILPSLNNRQKENSSSASRESDELNHKDVAVQQQSCGAITEDLKMYIREQCDVIEKRILLTVEEKLEELGRKQNQKLDKIVCLLSKLDSSC